MARNNDDLMAEAETLLQAAKDAGGSEALVAIGDVMSVFAKELRNLRTDIEVLTKAVQVGNGHKMDMVAALNSLARAETIKLSRPGTE